MKGNTLSVLLLTILLYVDVAYGACLRYDPEEVEVIGILVEKTYPGPPEYSSITRGDEPETFWILKSMEPLCVEAADNEVNIAESDITEVQLVFHDRMEEYPHKKNLLGKEVIVKGNLFHAITVHHRTKVLMSVIFIRSTAERDQATK